MAHRFRQRVLVPVLGVFSAVALLCVLALDLAASQSDQISVERQTREVHQTINDTLDELARTQEVAAVWDFFIQELQKPNPNWRWVDENVGTWLYRLFKHDQVFILNANDHPIYATFNGARRPTTTYPAANPALRELVNRLRGRTTAVNNAHERLPGRRLSPQATVRTSARAIHATDFMVLEGRPAAVSVMRVVPLTEAARPMPHGREALLVNVRFLDGSLLQELERNNLIEKPHFSHAPRTSAGESALQITSSAGKRIGYLVWRPDLPGSAMLRFLLPFVIVALILLGGIMALLAHRVLVLMRSDSRRLSELEEAHVELKASEAQAHHIAFHDMLTGLPNRALFTECADKAMARVRNGEVATILLLDLDRFKHVNDNWGHLAGDALIQEFGSRLAHIIGPNDTVARLGGDEFAIVTMDATSPEQTEALARGILDAVRQPFDVIGNQAYVGVSIGAATAPAAGSDRTELMRKADIALYRAKKEGRGCYRAFSPEMDETVRLRADLEEELRFALRTGQGLEVHYQPQLDGTGRSVVGLEALARWRHPTLGDVSPQVFVSIAEDTGLISQLGDWVLGEACAVALKWPELSIAVNLSPTQFRTSGFADTITAMVCSTGVDPRQIELEITEGILVDDDETVRAALRQLRKAGFRIALDDFGTGYSSLSYLRKFEVDKVKIDKSFVQHLGQAADSTAIVTAVITLGQAMGLTVTAEGVETVDQQNFLSAAGCNELQGFLYSRAVPEDQIEALLKRPQCSATMTISCQAS